MLYVCVSVQAVAEASAREREGPEEPESTRRYLTALRRCLGKAARRGLAARALAVWRAHTARAGHWRAAAQLQLRARGRVRARAVLSAWRQVITSQWELGRQLWAMAGRRLLRRCLRGWAAAVATTRLVAASERVVARRLQRRRLAASLAAWRGAVRGRQAACARAVTWASSRLRRATWAAWTAARASRAAARGVLQRLRAARDRELQRGALDALRAATARARRGEAMRRRGERRAVAAALRAWQGWVAARRRRAALARLLAARLARCAARAVLRAWLAASTRSDLLLSLLETMQAASSPAQHAQQPSGSSGWEAVPPSTGASAAAVRASAARMRRAPRLLLAAVDAGCPSRTAATAGSGAEDLLAVLPVLVAAASRTLQRSVALLRGWRRLAEKGGALRRAGVRLAARCRTLCLRGCLAAWRRAIMACCAAVVAATTLHRRLSAARTAECMRDWRTAAVRSSRLRRAAAAVLYRRLARRKRSVLSALRSHVYGIKVGAASLRTPSACCSHLHAAALLH